LCNYIKKFKDVAFVTGEFSRAFLWVHCNLEVRWSDLDVHTDHADIIASMSRQARISVGNALLAPRSAQTIHRSWFSSGFAIGETKFEKIREEISNGECFVCLHNGEVVRTLFLVTLRVRRDMDDKILVKLGSLWPQLSNVKTAVVLPGTKRKEEESSWVAARRLVFKDLAMLSAWMQVNFEEPELAASIQRSPSYGLSTRYLKTTYNARVKSDHNFPSKSFEFKGQGLPAANRATASQKSSDSRVSGSWKASHGNKLLNLSTGFARQVSPLSRASSTAAEDVFYNIRQFTLLPSSHGDGRHDVYAWLSEVDFETLRHTPEEMQKFLEAIWETEDWISSDGEGHEEIEEV